MTSIVQTIKVPRTNDPKEVNRFLEALAARFSYLVYAGDPTDNVTPRFYLDQCFNSSKNNWYRAYGTTSADWSLTGEEATSEDIPSPADTVFYETSFGISPVVGVLEKYARADHTHGSPTNPVPPHVIATDPHTGYLKEITPTTDNAIVRWNGTSGAAVENSGVRVDDNDDLLLNDSDKVRLGTGQDCDLYHDGTNNLIRLNNGELQIGGASHYAAIEADGTLEFNGDATVWDDIRVVPGSFDRVGVADPAIVSWTPSGSGTATYAWEFAKNDIASFSVQIPHGYKAGSDIWVHVHWTPGANGATESGNAVGWKVNYSWANIGAEFPGMSTADLSDACTGTDDLHEMTAEVQISGSGKTTSSMLVCNIIRTDTGADDTWSGTASGSLPLLLEIDFHYEIDTVGSRTRSAK